MVNFDIGQPNNHKKKPLNENIELSLCQWLNIFYVKGKFII
jgi:hypothetical protein